MLRVIVTGGGTGGHIYPALAIAQGLLDHEPDAKILYVGTRAGMEARIVPEAGWEFAGVSGRQLPRQLSVEMLKTTVVSFKALWETKEILRKFRPDLVIGTGGYVSGPVVLTAALFGIPTLLHEQNAWPGFTNRVLARAVRGVMVAFPESIKHFKPQAKVTVVGFPVRPEIGQVDRAAGARRLRLRPDRLTVLVTGGSRGARSINQAMATVAANLRQYPEVQLIWATGQATYEETLAALRAKGINWDRPQWRIMEYVQDMPAALACADLCITRAGAATLAELTLAGKPSILIPYPYAAANHQEHNARSLVENGAARLILDRDLSGERLWHDIEGLLRQGPVLEEMAAAAKKLARPDALDKIVGLCLETAWR